MYSLPLSHCVFRLFSSKEFVGHNVGCGANKHSWAFNGFSAPSKGLLADGARPFGSRKVRKGDVIGCEANLERGGVLSWSLNGDFGSGMGSCDETENIQYMLGLTPALRLCNVGIQISEYHRTSMLLKS
jgi:hypothetical protein